VTIREERGGGGDEEGRREEHREVKAFFFLDRMAQQNFLPFLLTHDQNANRTRQPTYARRLRLHRFSTLLIQQNADEQGRLVKTLFGPGPSRNDIPFSDQQNVRNCRSSLGYAHLAHGRPTVAQSSLNHHPRLATSDKH